MSYKIRPYQKGDRDAVRQLAYDTAEGGRPSTFPDPTLQMDLLTRYYTDHEPGSLWIAEQDGKVLGYLTGCLDTRRFQDWLKWRGNSLTLFHLLFRNLFRPAIWRWARARLRVIQEGGTHRPAWTEPYPAHLHVNLAAELRGQGAGGALVDRFVKQCQEAGVAGIHLAARGDNSSGHQFFERHGFARIATVSAYRPVHGGLEPVPVAILARALPKGKF